MADEILEDDLGDEEVEKDQYLVFNVKSREFGLQALRIKEISTVINTTEVPNAPSYIEGIMNLRGQLASVINFRKKFGFETKPVDEDTRIIIVEKDGFPIGILVDSVEEVIKILDDKVQKLPDSTRNSVSEECITGIGMLDNRLIILLDMDEILTKSDVVDLSRLKLNEVKNESTAKKVSVKQQEKTQNITETDTQQEKEELNNGKVADRG